MANKQQSILLTSRRKSDDAQLIEALCGSLDQRIEVVKNALAIFFPGKAVKDLDEKDQGFLLRLCGAESAELIAKAVSNK